MTHQVAPLEVVSRFIDGINAHQPATLAALMSADHRFVDSLGVEVSGADRVRAGWTGYFAMVPAYHLAINSRFGNADTVVLLGEARGNYAVSGQVVPDSDWRTPVAIRAVVRDGEVAEWQVFADNEPMRALMRRAG